MKADLDAFIAASDADLAPLLHEELQAAVSAYQDLKAKAGRLDFVDLLIKARDLIRDDESVRTQLQQRFTHYIDGLLAQTLDETEADGRLFD